MTKEGGPGRPALDCLPCVTRRLLPDAVAHRGDELAAGGVAGELPHEGAAEALRLGVARLAGDGGRGVVAPPVAAAPGVCRTADGAGGRARVLEDLVVLDAGLVRAGRRASRGAPGRVLGDAGPAAAVEADAEQDLAGRDA